MRVGGSLFPLVREPNLFVGTAGVKIDMFRKVWSAGIEMEVPALVLGGLKVISEKVSPG